MAATTAAGSGIMMSVSKVTRQTKKGKRVKQLIYQAQLFHQACKTINKKSTSNRWVDENGPREYNVSDKDERR